MTFMLDFAKINSLEIKNGEASARFVRQLAESRLISAKTDGAFANFRPPEENLQEATVRRTTQPSIPRR